MDKYQALQDLLRTYQSALVAFSGGVDSTLLAVVAHRALADQFLAVTAVSPTYPEQQLEEALALARQFHLPHQVVHTNEFESPDFLVNPPERCYYCKLDLYRQLRGLADQKGLAVILDGANRDDEGDYRPGHRAAAEMGVRSPFRELAFTKADIRELSRELGIPTWDKPAYACLASRIPYGTPITPEALARIDGAEQFLASLGLRVFRVRDHFPLARVEIGTTELELAWQNRQEIARRLHELGFPFVTLDLDGFRSGSMNELIKGAGGVAIAPQK